MEEGGWVGGCYGGRKEGGRHRPPHLCAADTACTPLHCSARVVAMAVSLKKLGFQIHMINPEARHWLVRPGRPGFGVGFGLISRHSAHTHAYTAQGDQVSSHARAHARAHKQRGHHEPQPSELRCTRQATGGLPPGFHEKAFLFGTKSTEVSSSGALLCGRTRFCLSLLVGRPIAGDACGHA